MATKISFSLSQSSIDSAIKQLEQYKNSLTIKCELFCKKLMEIGNVEAKAKIAEAPLGKYITVTTDIIPERMGCKAILMAVGALKESQWQTQDGVKSATVSTLLMVEFGSGIKANNPKATEMGYGTGTFPGATHSFDGSWSWMDLEGNWHSSSGISPTMPMYNADMKMILNIQKIARDVFRS